jgi:hypothetical protein
MPASASTSPLIARGLDFEVVNLSLEFGLAGFCGLKLGF